MYLRNDPYETSDAVFGVKESLIVDLHQVSDVEGLGEKYGLVSDMKLLRYDFVLVTDEESDCLREMEARQQAMKEGANIKVVNGLLISK